MHGCHSHLDMRTTHRDHPYFHGDFSAGSVWLRCANHIMRIIVSQSCAQSTKTNGWGVEGGNLLHARSFLAVLYLCTRGLNPLGLPIGVLCSLCCLSNSLVLPPERVACCFGGTVLPPLHLVLLVPSMVCRSVLLCLSSPLSLSPNSAHAVSRKHHETATTNG